MKKTLKSQLLAAVAMLLVAVIALSGATYAWFTSVSSAKVDGIDLYVKAGANLYLSAAVYEGVTADDAGYMSSGNYPNLDKAGYWHSTIIPGLSTDTTYDKINFTQPGAFPAQLRNVSNSFITATGKFWFGKYNETTTLWDFIDSLAIDEEKVIETNPFLTAVPVLGDYARFSLYVKSSTSGVFYLDMASVVSTVELLGKSHVKEAVRVAIGKPGEIPKIWEPNYGTHLGSTYGGSDAAGLLATASIDGSGAATTQTTQYFGTGGTNFKKGAAADDDTKIALFDLAADTPQKFVVYIWIEGGDVDTLNAIANASFTTMLQFGQDKTLNYAQATAIS